jgi:hypothetical protein
VRNHLLTTWLRRPAAMGWRAAAGALGRAESRAGLADAVRELPWALRHRRPLPDRVEEALATVEAGARSWHDQTSYQSMPFH